MVLMHVSYRNALENFTEASLEGDFNTAELM